MDASKHGKQTVKDEKVVKFAAFSYITVITAFPLPAYGAPSAPNKQSLFS